MAVCGPFDDDDDDDDGGGEYIPITQGSLTLPSLTTIVTKCPASGRWIWNNR